ncbi:hypothetical protein D3C81_1703280 [compost metagenome]
MINLVAFLHNIHVENVIDIHQIVIQLKLLTYMRDFFFYHSSLDISYEVNWPYQYKRNKNPSLEGFLTLLFLAPILSNN